LVSANTSYTFNPDEWCMGWSDIYYIPREYFADYIYLSAFYGAQNAFHELVIPTIMHIIDQSRRKKDFNSVINFLGHCFGGCCAPGADLNQIMSHRCGHKIDYLGDQEVITAHYERIERQGERLGTPVMEMEEERYENFSAFEKSLGEQARKAYQEMAVRPPPNHWRWDQINFGFNETGLELPAVDEKKPEEEEEEEKKVAERSAEAEAKGVENSKEWLERYGW
jgi:hypothetical protein